MIRQKSESTDFKANFLFIWRGGLAWCFAALMTALTGWTFVYLHLSSEKQWHEEFALKNAKNSAKIYADQVYQIFSTIDQLMLLIRYGWEISNKNFWLEEISQTGLFIMGNDFYLGIVDNNGNVITNTFPGIKKIDTGSMELFALQQQANSDFLAIGTAAHGMFTGRNVIRLSRRFLDQNGKFGGVVIASITTDYVTTGYKTFTHSPYDFIGISGKDNHLRATRIGSLVYAPDKQALKKRPMFFEATGGKLWDGKEWFDDNRSRYVAWVSLTTYPLIAMVGLDLQQAMSPYRNYRDAVIRNSLWATVALALLTAMIVAYSLRLSLRKRQLELTQVAYRVATEGAAEAFFIGHAVFNNRGEIVDLEFDDCNQRGADYLQVGRSAVIGKRLSSFFGGQEISRILGLLQNTVQSGFVETEMKVPVTSPLNMDWVQVKIVRQGTKLAINVRDITSMKAHVRELERRSQEDILTGLPNRQWLTKYFPDAISRARENNKKIAVMFIDLDGFKAVNDTMGHSAGDSILRNAAKRLKAAIRPGDCIARMGGDEFIVLIEDIHQLDDVKQVAERILAAFQQPFHHEQATYTVGTSIGISVFPDHGLDDETLLKLADEAMYLVKLSGKRNYRFYS